MTYVQPLLTAVCLAGILAILLFRSRRGRALGAAAVVLLIAVSWPPLDWLFSRPLESRYHRYPNVQEPVDAIVIFGSSFDERRPGHPIAIPDREEYERAEYAALLYKQSPQTRVLACGGPRGGESVGGLTADLVARAGVPRSAILTENRSRSTHENALFASDILRALSIRKVILVVDARSMPRASACLRRAGIEVVPMPCSFTDPPAGFEDWLPGWDAIRRNEITLHELVGLAWYKARGWI